MSHSPHPALAGRSHFARRLASEGLSNLATIVSTLVTVILPVFGLIHPEAYRLTRSAEAVCRWLQGEAASEPV